VNAEQMKTALVMGLDENLSGQAILTYQLPLWLSVHFSVEASGKPQVR
jgi:hypothetical protein